MIFNSVDALLEQVGRRRAQTWAELDTLTCLWNGPTSLADTSPQIGAFHPIYKTMEVKATRKVADVAGITKIELDYVGLFNGQTIGPVATDVSVSEQEIGYVTQSAIRTTLLLAGTPQAPGGLWAWKICTNNFVLRYQSQNAIFRYVARGKPTGPRFGSIANPQILTQFTRPAGQSSPVYVNGDFGGPPLPLTYYLGGGPFDYNHVPNIYCQQFRSQSISPSWYVCSETWGARFLLV